MKAIAIVVVGALAAAAALLTGKKKSKPISEIVMETPPEIEDHNDDHGGGSNIPGNPCFDPGISDEAKQNILNALEADITSDELNDLADMWEAAGYPVAAGCIRKRAVKEHKTAVTNICTGLRAQLKALNIALSKAKTGDELLAIQAQLTAVAAAMAQNGCKAEG